MTGLAKFNGLGRILGNLWQLSAPKTRLISPENFSGETGRVGMATTGMGASCARDLGPGWKNSPSVDVPANSTFTIADIQGPGAIQSLWVGGTCARDHSRLSILRIYWDSHEQPSVECPLRIFLHPAGLVLPGKLCPGGSQSQPRLELFLENAIPRALPHHIGEP